MSLSAEEPKAHSYRSTPKPQQHSTTRMRAGVSCARVPLSSRLQSSGAAVCMQIADLQNVTVLSGHLDISTALPSQSCVSWLGFWQQPPSPKIFCCPPVVSRRIGDGSDSASFSLCPSFGPGEFLFCLNGWIHPEPPSDV